MPLKITIHDPKPAYTANSTISGTVHFTCTSDQVLDWVSITLSGRSTSGFTITRNMYYTAYYEGRVQFLHMPQDLFIGPGTFGPNQHSWDFSFKLPAVCTSREGSVFRPGTRYYDLATGRARFDDRIGQPLPPSFAFSHYRPGYAFAGLVNYKLKVRLTRAKPVFLVHKKSTATMKLLILSTRDIAEPGLQSLSYRQPFDRRSLRLLPNYENHTLSAKEMMQSIVHSSRNFPLARFRLMLSTPRIAVLGQPLPIFLGLEHDVQISTAEAPPPVYLKYVKVVVKTCAKIRVVNPGLFRQRKDKVLSWSKSHKMTQGFGHGARASPVPVTAYMDLRKLMALELGPKALSPDFATFNVEVHHEMTAKVVVECARRRFAIHRALTELKVLPQVYRTPFPLTSNENVVEPSSVSNTAGSDYAAYQEEDIASSQSTEAETIEEALESTSAAP